MMLLSTGNLDRTNNQWEGWNNRFFHLVGYNHPPIWTLIYAIKKEDCTVTTLIAQDLIRQPPQKCVRCEYRDLQTRLLTLCRQRAAGNKTVEDFLSGIGHNIRWRPVNRHDD